MDEQNAIARPAPRSPDALFRAMGDPTRRRLLQLLIGEELSVSELVDVLRQPQSTISRHLKVLRDAGLVRDRRDGVTSYYRIRDAGEDRDELERTLFGWLGDCPVPESVTRRLQHALRRRDDRAVGFFERLGKRWDDLRVSAFGESFAAEAFIGLLPTDWTVADIGTGTGHLLPGLASHFRRVIAVEPATAMLECARHRVAENGRENVEFHQGDLGRLPIADGACDLALACLVLHHIEEPAAALRQMHRILKPGGRLLIVEQCSHELQEFYEIMQDLWWGFDPAEFRRDVEAAGFDDLIWRPIAAHPPASSRIEAPRLFVMTARRANRAPANVSHQRTRQGRKP
jgi:ArsR family transcriptional regulator